MDRESLIVWRAASGLTQAQLAERLGLSAWTVRQWEQGRRPLPGAWLELALTELDRQIANLAHP